MTAKIKWSNVELAMRAWGQVCLNGACRDLTAFPTIRLSSFTFTKAWRMYVVSDVKTAGSRVELRGYGDGTATGPTLGQFSDSISLNIFNAGASGRAAIWNYVRQAGRTYEQQLREKARDVVNKWFIFDVLPTLERKLIV